MDVHGNTLAREQWLKRLGAAMIPIINAKAPKPLDFGEWRVTCGWPSRGGLPGRKKRVRGECWHKEASAAGYSEIFISPVENDALGVAGILAHELVHAGLPSKTGHKAPFAHAVKAIGLEGKATVACAGPEFTAWVAPILAELGEYPHAQINGMVGGKTKKTYLLKACCPSCGYTVRITQKWLDKSGAPVCPECSTVDKRRTVTLEVDGMDDGEGEE